MAGESLVQVTEGAGKKLHTYQRTIVANNVEDEIVIPGEHYLPTYVVVGVGVSGAVVGDDILQLMAGAALNVRIRRIRVEQEGNITAAAVMTWNISRVTTAGTGGTAIVPQKMDNADANAGATAAQGVPNATHGTAAAVVHLRRNMFPVQTAPVGGLGTIPYWEWVAAPGGKPLIIPAGAANGFVIRNSQGRAGLTVNAEIEFTETAWL